MKRGLVVGKFYPPHSGHKYLIDQALAACDELDVLVCDSTRYSIDARARQQWIQEIHPSARVRVIPDIEEDDNSELWAAYTIAFLGYVPDVVYSSEDYGEQYAACMGAEHVMVDKQRVTVPISGTRVRKDPLKEWKFIEHPVRKDLAVRVVVVGAESTGTTTLAKALAEHYKAPWVPEYGRLYSEGLVYNGSKWEDKDFTHIAKVQQRLEQRMATKSNGLVICDTNATATQLWQERYLGNISQDVADIAEKDIVHYYLLTGDEIPFVQDGTRDGEHIRHDMHQSFIKMLKTKDVPFALIQGPKDQRLTQAIQLIDTYIEGYAIHD